MLTLIPVVVGKMDLGTWGRVELTGAESAVVRCSMAVDFELPSDVASDLPAGAAVLASEQGRLLLLPYGGNVVACVDLVLGELAFPLIQLGRSEEYGMRTSWVRIFSGRVLHLTEAGLTLYSESLDPSWMRAGDYLGWCIEGVVGDSVHLGASDWRGREWGQVISLKDGSVRSSSGQGNFRNSPR